MVGEGVKLEKWQLLCILMKD